MRRRELGAYLRDLRLTRGLTVEQVAAELLCAPSKISRMETGQRDATARDIRDLYDLYEVGDQAQRARLTSLVAGVEQQGWWHTYELDYFATSVGLEEAANAIRQYQSMIVPGLLETPEYARAMAEVLGDAPDRVNELVEVKVRRQRRLAVESFALLRVLDEAVLHRAVGGATVMQAQLNHLIELTRIHNVTVRVIPYSAGAHAAMESMFIILDLDHPMSNIVYVEGLIGFLYLERPRDIARYEQAFDRLLALALSPQDSIEFIRKVAMEYQHDPTDAVKGPHAN
jgi:transcriptional regulator with XRE-family HTH domain